MAKQENIWNPPPCFIDYRVTCDPWNGLASLMTLLDNCEINSKNLTNESTTGKIKHD